MGSREDLIQSSIPFLREVKDMTPGAEMERWLNERYGEDSQLYRDLARLIKRGVEEGWAANQEVDGPNYRRSRILEPTPDTDKCRRGCRSVWMRRRRWMPTSIWP